MLPKTCLERPYVCLVQVAFRLVRLRCVERADRRFNFIPLAVQSDSARNVNPKSAAS
jgi:hypothetical protein